MSDFGGKGYDLHNILTNLAARVGATEGTLRTFMENWTAQDKLAHDARRTVYERLDLIGRQVERVATDVENIQQDVAELKKEVDEDIFPSIKKYDARVHQAVGARGVWALIGGVAIAAVSGLAWLVDKAAGWLGKVPV